MLNLKPYLTDIEGVEPGQTIRINHTDCDAGEDTRRRLYITRPHANEAMVTAYCHNCQQGGYYADPEYQSYRHEKHHGTMGKERVKLTDKVEEPKGLISEISAWPTLAQSWAYIKGITQTEASWYGIKYDPSTNRVYLPRWDVLTRGVEGCRTLVGYQLRQLSGYDRPKYLTAQNKDAKNYTFIHPSQGTCNYVVIVEDMVSAIHIIRATEIGDGNLPGVFINYGTKVDPTMMYNIARDYEYATVWLDNDNQHVINQANLMTRTIALYNDDISVRKIEDSSDPKHYASEEICLILDEVWNG